MEHTVEKQRDARVAPAHPGHDQVVGNVPALAQRIGHLQEDHRHDRQADEFGDAGNGLVEEVAPDDVGVDRDGYDYDQHGADHVQR